MKWYILLERFIAKKVCTTTLRTDNRNVAKKVCTATVRTDNRNVPVTNLKKGQITFGINIYTMANMDVSNRSENVLKKTVSNVRKGILRKLWRHWVHSDGRVRLKRDGTRAETRFRLSPKRTSPFTSAGPSVQWTACSRGLRISGSNAG